MEAYTCVICNNLFNEATALKKCHHIFCWNCIHEKITQHGWQLCPICGMEFGPEPLRRLSHDDPILLSLENNEDNEEDVEADESSEDEETETETETDGSDSDDMDIE